jgi:hypothetical protein
MAASVKRRRGRMLWLWLNAEDEARFEKQRAKAQARSIVPIKDMTFLRYLVESRLTELEKVK